jgi:AraC-like DNA-binding protein
MDRLSPFFNHFTLSARVFYSGRMCGVSGNHEQNTGHLHVIRSGTLKVTIKNRRSLLIDEPTVLFFARAFRHQFSSDDGAEIVCAAIEFGSGMLNTLVHALPEMLVVPLKSAHQLLPAVELMFAEAFSERPGRQTAVDRLAEYFLVLLLRSAIDARLVNGGVLMGLADPRLAKAITAIHARPEHSWTLEELADEAGMSRARFAVHFRSVVGATPFDYVADWRIGVAQSLLNRGKPLKIVAPSVGYASSTALTRAFTQRIGLAPTDWLRRHRTRSD